VRTLFLRIFLSFWAAMLLVLLATAAVAWYRFSQVETLDLNALAPQASERLHKDGLEGLRSWIFESQEKYIGRNIFVVDYTGVDILGRTLPDRLTSYVRRLERAGLMSKGVPRDREPNPLLLTPQFFDRDDSVYTLMVESSAGPWGVLNTPNMRAVLVVFALAISGLVCWWLARYVSKPVERLQSSVRSLAAGNLDSRVGDEFSRRHDELGVLARDFDVMADHVRALIASKESLLPALSHELRSPLARLRVALSLARRGTDVTRQFDRIELETERLDVIIGQMLQLSHLRAMEPTLTRVPVDLTTLLTEVVEDARIEANAANKGVEWNPTLSVEIEGDHDLIRSAIENVLRNAVRFTREGTAVDVSMTREGGDTCIVIEDHGPGVPEAELERIFEPFHRVTESRDRDSGGTGLGLAITARVVGLYGGAVKARNRHGDGLTVEIRLPAAA
jgi:two-component system sensor histidine kinase CpxA